MSPSTSQLFHQAERYVCRDPGERALFDRLERDPSRTYRLTVNHRNDDHFDPRTDTIAWDPYSALRTTNGGRQSPALGLGHEVAHAVEPRDIEQRLAHHRLARYDNAEERRVIRGSECRAARTLGEATRKDHDGTCYRVSSPVRVSA
ncbi:MAG TPA: hypothetical protein VGF18_03250 [Candidatus Tumulicola sp.]